MHGIGKTKLSDQTKYKLYKIKKKMEIFLSMRSMKENHTVKN